MELHHNAAGGGSMSGSGPTATIIISNQSLVLQGVSRREAGHYTCGAENAEGPGPHSKSFYLDVLCELYNYIKKTYIDYNYFKKHKITIFDF